MSSNDINDHSQWDKHVSKSYALSGKIMLSAIIILFVVVIFMVFLHIYGRWYLLRVRRRHLHRRRIRRQRATHIVFYVDPNSAASVPTRGIDASVLGSLPVFVYSSLTHPDGLDCAVCLSEFEDKDKGRILPKCHHSFHSECIDMWFHSHSTCPICRAPVEAEAPVEAPQNNNRSELVVSIDERLGSEPAGSSSAVCSSCDPTEGGSMGTTSLADRRRKGLDLVGVRIEVPRRSESVDELRLRSPASVGYRSPGNRLQSLKRILSMNRKSATVSPSSGIGGPSCGSVGGELDVELGKCESTHGQTRAPTPR